MMAAIKISIVWIPLSLMFFIAQYGGGSHLQPWQAIVMIGPALLIASIELIKSLMETRHERQR